MTPRPTWEVLNRVYNEDYLDETYYDMKSLNKSRISEVYPKKIEVLKKAMPSGRMVDIGAGLGGFVYLAKKAGYDVEGWETSVSQVAMAKALYGIELRCGTLSEGNYSNGTFDIVHLHHVLEHVPNPTATLRLILNVLKSGGLFYFEVPNEFQSSVFYYKRFMRFLGKDIRFSKPSLHHLYFFNYSTILEYIKKVGFKLIFVEGRFHEVKLKYPFLKNAVQALTLSKRFAPSFEVLCQKS
jgi:2-polyprenyl-3-methyl-5-hydroxy-6-metoxy-1,4-benzoquinol methylase